MAALCAAAKQAGCGLLAAMLVVAAPHAARGQAQTQAPGVPAVRAATFGWYAELVSFDAATRTMTVKARIEPHVARYVTTFAPGDRLVLVWTQFGGHADAIRYVASEQAMSVKSGYVVRGRFVSADPKAATLTFAVPVPVALAASLASAKPAMPVRVGAPLSQPGPDAVLTAVSPNTRAPARPAPAAPKAAPVENARAVAGMWSVNSNLMGNAVKLECAFTQEGKTIGGTCKGPGPIGSPAVTGSIDGDDIAFQFGVSQGGVSLALRHVGKLNGDGDTIEGSLDLMGNVSPFKATKQ